MRLLLILALPLVFGFTDNIQPEVGSRTELGTSGFTHLPNQQFVAVKLNKKHEYIPLNVHIKLQAGDEGRLLREFELESRFETEDKVLKISAGIHSAEGGFFTQYDDVSTSAMSTLPQGVYNYAFMEGGHVDFLGGRAEYIKYLDKGWKFISNTGMGIGIVNNKRLWEEAMFSGHDTESDNYDIEPGNVYMISLGLAYRLDFKAAITYYETNVSMVRTGDGYDNDISDILFTSPKYKLGITKVGIRYFVTENLELITEAHRLDVREGVEIPPSGGYYVLAQYYGEMDIIPTIGYSATLYDDSDYRSYNRDIHVGVAYIKGKFSIGAEYHRVTGDSWAYSGNIPEDTWDSVNVKWGYRYK